MRTLLNYIVLRNSKAFALHKYIGLITGVVVFIVSITGACWVFKEEVEGFYNEFKTVEVIQKERITATQAKDIAESYIPDQPVHGVIYGADNEALEVVFYRENPEFYQSVFLNPYSGDFIKRVNHFGGFFGFVLRGHMYLWLPNSIGALVVEVSIFLFLIMVITGIILWWPKKRKNLKSSLKISWKSTTRWRRKNYDLHKIVGFYSSILAFVFGFTGSVIALGWFYFIYYTGMGGEKLPMFVIPNSEKIAVESVLDSHIDNPIDNLIPFLEKDDPKAKSFELHFPDNDSTSIYVEVVQTEGLTYNIDYRFFDQNTLEEQFTYGIYGSYKHADFADKAIRMNYDIHIGAIGGLPGKIIAFLASLVTATLPVTGIVMWFGRRKKTKKARP